MDLVTVVAACALGLHSGLFVPLGLHPDCARAGAAGREVLRSNDIGPAVRWVSLIEAASRRFGIPERIIRAVMQAESAGNPMATSPAGAMGLMQLMPETWATMRARYRLGADPYAPGDNIMAGTAFLRELIGRYGAPGFLAAYNAGPARLEAHLTTGRPLPEETQHYLSRLWPKLQDSPDSTSQVLLPADRRAALRISLRESHAGDEHRTARFSELAARRRITRGADSPMLVAPLSGMQSDQDAAAVAPVRSGGGAIFVSIGRNGPPASSPGSTGGQE